MDIYSKSKSYKTSASIIVTAIYCIVNLVNGKYYIGSSSNIHQRWIWHLGALKRNNHHSSILQHSWNKHGEDSFEFRVIEECEIENLEMVEQYWIDAMNPHYNIARVAWSKLGCKHTSETKAKIGAAHKGKIVSKETREKLSKHNKGIPLSEERKAKMKGNIISEETREKISNALKGKPKSAETKEKMKASRTKEYKENLSKKLSGRKLSAEHIKKLKQRTHTEETRRKIGNSHAKSWTVITPDGCVYDDVFNLSAFCREHNLDENTTTGLRRVANGERKTYKGWKCRRYEAVNAAPPPHNL